MFVFSFCLVAMLNSIRHFSIYIVLIFQFAFMDDVAGQEGWEAGVLLGLSGRHRVSLFSFFKNHATYMLVEGILSGSNKGSGCINKKIISKY